MIVTTLICGTIFLIGLGIGYLLGVESLPQNYHITDNTDNYDKSVDQQYYQNKKLTMTLNEFMDKYYPNIEVNDTHRQILCVIQKGDLQKYYPKDPETTQHLRELHQKHLNQKYLSNGFKIPEGYVECPKHNWFYKPEYGCGHCNSGDNHEKEV